MLRKEESSSFPHLLRESNSSNLNSESPEVRTNTLSLKAILRFASLFAPLVLLAAPGQADVLTPGDTAAYKRAFKSAEKGKWDIAMARAMKATDPLPRKALQWMRIIEGRSQIPFADLVAFADANPHWPQQTKLRIRAEEAIDEKTPKAEILAWFQNRPPATGIGAYHLVRTLLEDQKTPEATAAARHAWVHINMGYQTEQKFRKRYGKLLRKEDHIARLDRLLWDRRTSSARRQLRRMSHDYQWLGLARIALMRREAGVDYAVSKVPERLLKDPGIIYERVRWRRKNRLYESAIDLLKEAGEPKVAHKKWWTERRILTRWLLRQGRPEQAYELVRAHSQSDGLPLAEGEWLAGWIALRSLHRYVDAFDHFRRMFENVSYPVSKARAAYWAGRAAEAGGKLEIARQWYEVAATHVTSFYGQLAAAKLPVEGRPKIPAEPNPSETDQQAFGQMELVRLVRMMAAMGLSDEIDPFVRQLAQEANTAVGWTLVADIARDHKRQDLAIYVAKKALRDGVVLSRLGYPDLLLPMTETPDPAFVKAVVRQESAFDPKAISHAGARGLMQLMPATASRVARRLSIPYSRARLTRDPQYNVTIGRAYLLQLLEEYDGSPILALSAYNAGPARVARWLKSFGDPNRSVEDAVDWIESIPFYETRNYVQRVLENFTVYRGRGGGTELTLAPSVPLSPPPRAIVP
jgi:soluble lytic murein transglycosylase